MAKAKIPYTVIIADVYSPCATHTAWVRVDSAIPKKLRSTMAVRLAYDQFIANNVMGDNAVVDQQLVEDYPLIGCYEGHLVHCEPIKEWWI